MITNHLPPIYDSRHTVRDFIVILFVSGTCVFNLLHALLPRGVPIAQDLPYTSSMFYIL